MATFEIIEHFFGVAPYCRARGSGRTIQRMSTSIFQNVIFSFAILFVLASRLALGAGVEEYPEILTPGSKYYFDGFDPKGKPWVVGKPLNIEEVFKNYQYVEIVVDHDGKAITVIQYIQGSKRETVRYQVMPGGALRKDE